jgi:hypothetical protein
LARVELASAGKRPAFRRIRTLIDARSAGLHRPHLLFVRQDRSAKPEAAAEVEMATVRVVPFPRGPAGQRSVKVDWVAHVSDLGMFDLDAHAATLRPHDVAGLYDAVYARALFEPRGIFAGREQVAGVQGRPCKQVR